MNRDLEGSAMLIYEAKPCQDGLLFVQDARKPLPIPELHWHFCSLPTSSLRENQFFPKTAKRRSARSAGG